MTAYLQQPPVPCYIQCDLAMYWLKMCPRCQGDLYEQEDRFGRYLACLQCGRSLGSVPQMALGTVTTGESSSRWKHAVKKE